MPLISPKRTDFPAPFGPTIERISPSRASKEMSFTATRPAKCLLTPLTCNSTRRPLLLAGIRIPDPLLQIGYRAHHPPREIDDDHDQQSSEDDQTVFRQKLQVFHDYG